MKLKKLLVVCLAIVFVLSLVALAACNHEHEYTEWDYNNTQHWKICSKDGEIDETSRASHKLVNGVCECGFTHEHDYSTWRYDETYHWKVCSRDGDIDASSKAEHNFVNRVCECGAETAHEHSFTGWGFDANEHWRVCPADNAADMSSYAAHSWDANCTCECGATNHSLAFVYTSETAPAPVAEGGAVAAVCNTCSQQVDVAYNYGIAGADVAELTDNGRYYVSSAVAGSLKLKFEVLGIGTYSLSFTDVVIAGGQLSVTVDGEASDKCVVDGQSVTCQFVRADLNKIVEIELALSDVAVVPFVLVDYNAPKPAPTGNFVAHFYNSKNWSDVYVYSWENGGSTTILGAWPGTVIPEADEDGWYSAYYNVTEGSWNGTTLGVIFNNGSGTQTQDCMPTQNEVWITVDSELFYSKEDAEAHLRDMTPVPSDVYILVGQIGGANNWQETTASWSRVFSESNNYTLTVNFVEGDSFKVKLNQTGWDSEYGYTAMSASGDNGLDISGLFSEGENSNIDVNKACTCQITFRNGSIVVVVTSIG